MFSLAYVGCGCGSGTQTATNGATSLLANSLADGLGHIVEGGHPQMSEPVPSGGVLVVDGIRGSRSGPFFLDAKTQHGVCRGSSRGMSLTSQRLVSLASDKEEINMYLTK